MRDRIPADVVADLRELVRWFGPMSAESALTLAEAADLIERLDALRPPCPTCGGSSFAADGLWSPCRDCSDGRMPFERMAATYRAVWDDNSSYDLYRYLRSIKP